MRDPHIRWAAGGVARILAVTVDAIALESSTPSPPGSRIDGVLAGGSGRTVRVKVHASRKQASGEFRLEGRPIDLTREGREELVALVEASRLPSDVRGTEVPSPGAPGTDR